MISYRTKDLSTAAFLWCQPGTNLLEVEPSTEGRPLREGQKPETFYFRFELDLTEEQLKDLMYSYANEATCVEPQAFVRKQNNLRDLLYNVKSKFRRK